MVYTCYEMIRDCREDRPQGWTYLISNYVPVMRKLLGHYAPADEALLRRVLVAAKSPGSSLFQSLEPAPERWFVAELRQKVLAEIARPDAEIALDLETVSAALDPLTLSEKQAAWIETMGYDAQQTGAMLRMASKTVAKIRDRAADLLRGSVDQWRRTILVENGLGLGRAAAALHGQECLPVKLFLDVLDGRTTWSGRDQLELHVKSCWHCIDHFCRMTEVIELLRGIQPLPEQEAAPFRDLLGVAAPKRPAWRRWLP